MRALVITPGQAGSARLAEVAEPMPQAGEVLVRVLEAGTCGTDVETNQGRYGEAPPSSPYLILGHESLGHVAQVTPGVTALRPGDLVVAMVRRPDDCLNCRHGEWDLCLTGNYRERGIKGVHGFMADYYTERPEFLIRLPSELRPVGVLLEPLSIVEKAIAQCFKIQERMIWEPKRALVLGTGTIGLLAVALLRLQGLETYALARSERGGVKSRLAQEIGATYLEAGANPVHELSRRWGNLDLIIEATGNSAVAFEALQALGTNGVLCLTSLTAGDRHAEIPTDVINLQMVLGNKVVFGSVNANRAAFAQGVTHLREIEGRWPGWLSQIITRRLPMARYPEALERDPGGIKTVLVINES